MLLPSPPTVYVRGFLTSGQIAMQMPSIACEINQPGGILTYGRRRITNTLAILDRLIPAPPWIRLGTPGRAVEAQNSVWLQVEALRDKAQGIWIDPTE